MANTSRLAALAALAFASLAPMGVASCARPVAKPISGDDAPELFVGQSRLRDMFADDGAGFLVSPVLDVPHGATRVAVWAATDVDANDLALDLEVRGYTAADGASRWIKVDMRWHEDAQRVGRAELGEVVDAVELRLPESQAERIAGLVWSAVTPEPVSLIDASGASTALQRLDIPGVQPRSAWNARAVSGCSNNTTKTWITVHHSVSALQAGASTETHAAAVRGIQAYHIDGRGYCDIGYHFAVTADGTVWEAREARFLGAHTGSHNTNNAGVVFVGCFHPTSDCNGLGSNTPPQNMLDAGGTVIGNIAAHYGITINAQNVIGHRDNPDQTTSCPGDNLHDELATLRDIAQGGGTPPPPPPASTGKVQGVVWDLSITTDASLSDDLNARLVGASVSVTGGGTTTAREGDAYWSFDLAPGTYTFTAALAGFAPASREVQVAAGANLWASIGIAPQQTALELTVRVVDFDTGLAIQNAEVVVTGQDPAQTDGDGEVTYTLNAGDVTIVVNAEGYLEQSVTRTLVAGAPVTVDIELEPVFVDDPEDPIEDPEDPIDDPEDPEGPLTPDNHVERITIMPPAQVSGGCAQTTAGDAAPLLALALLAPLLASYPWSRRPRRRCTSAMLDRAP